MPNLLGQILGMGHLWAILGLSWGHLGPVWSHLGLSWGYLGVILGLPGATLPLLYCPPISVKIFAPAFCRCEMFVFGILLLWQFPELLLENPWGHLAPSWPILQAPWSHLGPYWAHLGPILGLPGAILAELTQNLPWQSLCNAKFARANFA